MKVLHIISSLEIGGAQRLLADLLPLINKFCDITVLTLQDKPSPFIPILYENGIKVECLKCKNIYSLYNIFKIRKYIKKNDFEIVHAHLFPTIYWVAVATIFNTNIKLAYTEHSTHNRRRDKSYFRPIEQFIYKRINKVISISQQTQDNLLNWLHTKSNKKFIVIENGINFERFENANVIRNDKCHLIMISRFVESKDQETVIKSLCQLPKEINLTLVGDGPNLKNCQELAAKLNLTNRIDFLGSRNDIPQILEKSYIGIQSSNWEGFGLTAVEIMASGIPVIASDVKGLREVVLGAGLLFNPHDDKMLANKIMYLLNNKDIYDETVKKCIERSKKYDIKVTAQKYFSIYKNMIN